MESKITCGLNGWDYCNTNMRKMVEEDPNFKECDLRLFYSSTPFKLTLKKITHNYNCMAYEFITIFLDRRNTFLQKKNRNTWHTNYSCILRETLGLQYSNLWAYTKSSLRDDCWMSRSRVKFKQIPNSRKLKICTQECISFFKIHLVAEQFGRNYSL